ncbi:MAG: TraB/GumN family protein [Proteobacteria bacterium]|nr:MAG: TraB/GumN family protein [Pseudomonadota bacterium]
MRRPFPSFSFPIILSICLLLTQCVTPANSADKLAKARQSFLWEAKKGEERLTLVGTMHIGITPDDMDPKLWNQLQTADVVIIETDIGGMNPKELHSYMTLPPSEDLRGILGSKPFDRLSEIIAKSGSALPEAQLLRMTPLAAGTLLLQVQAKADQEIAAGQVSIDQVIFERAQEMGKTTRTLETNREQLDTLKTVFDKVAIVKMLEEWDEETSNYEDMKNAFKTGDSETLDSMLAEIPEEVRAELLDKRNANWIKKLPSLQKNHTLIAVGAAHYAGKRGLLKLLRDKGYTIKPL